jgi:hypothetical protein
LSRRFVAPLVAVGAGLVYGVLCRMAFNTVPRSRSGDVFVAVSVAYLFLVPYALGVLTAALAPLDLPPSRRWLWWLLTPCATAFLLLVTVLALAWEGAICLVFAGPVVLGMAMLGGLTVGLVVTWRGRRPPPGAVASCLVLPFLFAPAEARVPAPDQMRTVTSVVDIAAPPDVVWRHVVRVPLIREDEQHDGFFRHIGIPRPLEATLDGEGVGALREARFAGGIQFHEHVTDWDPGRQLGFTIGVDAATVSNDVLDYHVRVGGAYFDVVYGRFDLEPRPGGTRLHLLSRHRLSTRFNFYSGFWTDAVMQDIQDDICRVIRARSEEAARSGAAR